MEYLYNIPFPLLLSGIAVIALLLFFILIWKTKQLDDQLNLKRHRSQDDGFADLLNYAAVVGDGVIANKNGSLMASWAYSCDDAASSTCEQRNAVCVRINNAIKDLGNGWMIHVDAVRQNAPGYPSSSLSCFPDKVSKAIDQERRNMFLRLGQMYEGYFVLTLTYYPPYLAEKKFSDLMFDDDQQITSKTDRTNNLIDEFQLRCKEIESNLSCVLKMKRLKGVKKIDEYGNRQTNDEQLQWLQYCITGLNHPIKLPDTPIYIDHLIGGKEVWTGVIPKIGDKYVQIVAIDGLPLESEAGMLSILAELPIEYRWSNRFILMDRHEATSKLEKFRKKWKQKIRGVFDQIFNTNSGAVNQDAVNMVQDAVNAIEEVESGFVSAGYYTSCVILMDPNRNKLESNARKLATFIQDLGFGARIETINTMDALFGSFPGHGYENIRRPVINSLNLSHMIPTSTVWTGEKQNPCPMYPAMSPPLMNCVTQGSSPFRLNLHVDDVGHTLIFGPTGYGKSTFLATLALQMRRYQDMKIYAFDYREAMYPAVKAVGGEHYHIGTKTDQLAFCPLQYINTPNDRVFAMGWIDDLLKLNGVETTPAQRNEIANAINNMFQSKSYSLSEFTVTVQDTAIREALKPYTIDGQMGTLLDAKSDNLALSNFTVFETDELMDLGDKYALPILLYLFRRIEKSLNGQPTAIILDEAWLMLDHIVFREKIREWLKVLRKANCLVILATQSLSDAANSKILDVLIESTATKIFLPNPYANSDEDKALYRRMKLNDQQINIIANAKRKREYYYVSANGRRKFELALGPLALSFTGATDKKSLKTIKKLVQQHGQEWVNRWLEMRGLNINDYIISERV